MRMINEEMENNTVQGLASNYIYCLNILMNLDFFMVWIFWWIWFVVERKRNLLTIFWPIVLLFIINGKKLSNVARCVCMLANLACKFTTYAFVNSPTTLNTLACVVAKSKYISEGNFQAQWVLNSSNKLQLLRYPSQNITHRLPIVLST